MVRGFGVVGVIGVCVVSSMGPSSHAVSSGPMVSVVPPGTIRSLWAIRASSGLSWPSTGLLWPSRDDLGFLRDVFLSTGVVGPLRHREALEMAPPWSAPYAQLGSYVLYVIF